MSRGFLVILYRSTGPQARVYGQTRMPVWKTCLWMAVRSFRCQNPAENLLILDLDGLLTLQDRSGLNHLGEVLGPESLPRGYFGNNLYNKIRALRWSPFDDTALFDLDVLVTGALDDVFSFVDGGLGAMFYPRYYRRQTGVSTAVFVARGKADVAALLRLSGEDPYGLDDEGLLDVCLATGRLQAARIPDSYGKSKQVWWSRSEVELTHSCASLWTGPLHIDWQSPRPVFWLGEERVQGFHFSGAKERYITDGMVNRYMTFIGAEMEETS